MNRRIELFFLVLIDLIAFNVACWMYYKARHEWHFWNVPTAKVVDLTGTMIVFSVFWLAFFSFSGLYRARFASSRFDEITSILKVVSIGILLLFFVIFIDSVPKSGRFPIISYWFSLCICVVLGRLILRTIQKSLIIRGYGTHNTLIVGWGDLLGEVHEEVKRYPAAGLKVVGLIDLKNDASSTHSNESVQLKALPSMIDELRVQDVLIALGSEDHGHLEEILQVCDGKPVSLKLVPDFYNIIGGMAKTEHIYGLPLIEVSPEPMAAWEQSTKRLVDVWVAFFTLLITSPLLLTIALIIKLSSKGRVIYRQKRVGRYGKVFTMLKFRTMYENAEAESGPVWAKVDDPRYTPIGRWLRKLRMDELPQLWNVLLGQMSLVGPRPERPYFVEKLVEEIPLYSRRHRVKPGITGLAQVKWKYDESLEDVRQKVKYDLFYIENMSLKQDIRILFQTIRITFLGKGQ